MKSLLCVCISALLFVFVVKHARIIGIATLILVLSTFGYGQFSVPSVNGGLPSLSCQGVVDLSTGTLGTFGADSVGTSEGAGGWQFVSGPTGTPGPAVSAPPFQQPTPVYATTPFVATTGGPPGRINWISYSNPLDTGSGVGTFIYKIAFTVPAQGGFFGLLAFSADNSVQLTLSSSPATVWSSGNYPTQSATDFKTWWMPGSNAVGPGPVVSLPGGSYTVTAAVANGGGETALAVKAVCATTREDVVGGAVVPVNYLQLLAPELGLLTLIGAFVALMIVKRNRRANAKP
jgi:hypothetical protein